MRSQRALVIVLAAVAVLAALAIVATAVVLPRLSRPDPEPGGATGTVTVMTRNVYLGGDISRPVRAARGRTGPEALAALGRANDALRATVDETDFRVRSRLLAAEIAAAGPDLVGLQEVALWRTGPLEIADIGAPDATEVEYDFLDLLLAELTRAGAAYEVVQVQEEADVEAPAFPDPRRETGRTGRDVRLTLRDVILVGADSGLTVRGRGSAQYAARLGVGLAGARFDYVRGYAWADVVRGDARFRFVTTHLESDSDEVTNAQAAELLAGPVAGTADPVVLACDCNAGPTEAAYATLTGGGLADTRSGPGGETFGLSETVDDETPSFERRIDHVLVRGLPLPEYAVTDRTGEEPGDRDPATGLWPSDHAGVLARLPI